MLSSRQATIVVVLLSAVILLVTLATLPQRVDRLLLSNDNLCTTATTDDIRGWNVLSIIDSGVDLILWRALLLLWDVSEEKSSYNVCNVQSDQSAEEKNICKFEESKQTLHPICRNYRNIRSTISIGKICIPWNWYYSTQFQLNQISIRSTTQSQHVPRVDLKWELWTSYCINSQPKEAEMKLPPALYIQAMDVSFQSWSEPVVSLRVNGVRVNIVVQKGKLAMPSLPILHSNNHDTAEDMLSLLLGDMTIREAISMLPKPPEKEGLYPMIGLINVSNVSVNVIEQNSKSGEKLSRLNQLNIPDGLFAPLLNLTSGIEFQFTFEVQYMCKTNQTFHLRIKANQPKGIDRFHFNSHLESAFSDALRNHLFIEAERALNNSLTAAIDFKDMIIEHNSRFNDQFQVLVHKTQQLYVDKWLELGAQAIQQTKKTILNDWVNITAPLSNALKAWTQDVQNAIADSKESPLKVVMVHHWDHITHWIHDHDFTFSDLASAPENNKPIRSLLHSLAAKSRNGIDELVANCEGEIREMWMAWHLQFMPNLD